MRFITRLYAQLSGCLLPCLSAMVVDTAWLAHNECSELVGNTPFDDVFRQGMQQVVSAPGSCLSRPLWLDGGIHAADDAILRLHCV